LCFLTVDFANFGFRCESSAQQPPAPPPTRSRPAHTHAHTHTRHVIHILVCVCRVSILYLAAPRLVKDFANVPEKTDLDAKVVVAPGAGWKSARGATPGARKPRAGYYQRVRHEHVAAGWEAGSDEDDDATELPPWSAILRTGEGGRGRLLFFWGADLQAIFQRTLLMGRPATCSNLSCFCQPSAHGLRGLRPNHQVTTCSRDRPCHTTAPPRPPSKATTAHHRRGRTRSGARALRRSTPRAWPGPPRAWTSTTSRRGGCTAVAFRLHSCRVQLTHSL
jgi:hypothetical protein